MGNTHGGSQSMNVLNTGEMLRNIARDEIQKQLANLPISQPAQVKSRNGVYVSAVSLLNFGKNNTTFENVTLLQNPYINIPIKSGDIGLLIPCSFAYSNMIEGKTDLAPVPTMATGSYFFLPLVTKSSYQGEDTNTTLYSQSGTETIKVTDNGLDLLTDAITITSNKVTILGNLEVSK